MLLAQCLYKWGSECPRSVGRKTPTPPESVAACAFVVRLREQKRKLHSQAALRHHALRAKPRKSLRPFGRRFAEASQLCLARREELFVFIHAPRSTFSHSTFKVRASTATPFSTCFAWRASRRLKRISSLRAWCHPDWGGRDDDFFSFFRRRAMRLLHDCSGSSRPVTCVVNLASNGSPRQALRERLSLLGCAEEDFVFVRRQWAVVVAWRRRSSSSAETRSWGEGSSWIGADAYARLLVTPGVQWRVFFHGRQRLLPGGRDRRGRRRIEGAERRGAGRAHDVKGNF